MVKVNQKEGRLNFSLMDAEVMNSLDLIFICVGTPDDGTGKTSLEQIDNAISFIIENVHDKKILVISVAIKS